MVAGGEGGHMGTEAGGWVDVVEVIFRVLFCLFQFLSEKKKHSSTEREDGGRSIEVQRTERVEDIHENKGENGLGRHHRQHYGLSQGS